MYNNKRVLFVAYEWLLREFCSNGREKYGNPTNNQKIQNILLIKKRMYDSRTLNYT